MREQQSLRKVTNAGNIARKEESKKQEQIRERVLDYMLPPSQPSISMSNICLGMRRYHKQEIDYYEQDVDKLLSPPTATCWVRPAANCLGSQMGTLEVTLLGLFCDKVLGEANGDLLGLAYEDFKVIDFDYLIPSSIITVILTIPVFAT